VSNEQVEESRTIRSNGLDVRWTGGRVKEVKTRRTDKILGGMGLGEQVELFEQGPTGRKAGSDRVDMKLEPVETISVMT